MCPILLRNKIVVLRSAFLGIWLFRIGFSDVGAVEQAREWSPKTTRPDRRNRLPGLVLICRRIRDYPIVALCLSSSESASFERAPETMSWIQT